jgi:predicted TIM-barrel fold metal-dependent hydrolase
MLQDVGCMVVDSAASVREALKCVEAGGFETALLHGNPGGSSAKPVTEALVKAGIPFAFATGYGRAGLAAHLGRSADDSETVQQCDLEGVLLEALGV